MGRKVRRSADQGVVEAGESDETLLAPGRTRAQRLREAQPQSPPVANSQSTLTTKSLEDLTILDIKTILNQNEIPFDSRARKATLLDILNRQKQHEASQESSQQPSKHCAQDGSKVCGQLTESTETDQLHQHASETRSINNSSYSISPRHTGTKRPGGHESKHQT
jgi:hypothetical protein